MKYILINEVLPVEELRMLGLLDMNKHLLSDENLIALLSGRRTSLLTLERLTGDSLTVDRLDAKLSMDMSEGNLPGIRIHPVNKEPKLSPELLPHENDALISSTEASIVKLIPLADGKNKTLVFEYDGETREFISYDPKIVEVPVLVNGERLNMEQREAFAHGKVVELEDGTQFRYRAADPKGIVADRSDLIISNQVDEGLMHHHVSNIVPLSADGIRQPFFTDRFKEALKMMQEGLLEFMRELGRDDDKEISR